MVFFFTVVVVAVRRVSVYSRGRQPTAKSTDVWTIRFGSIRIFGRPFAAELETPQTELRLDFIALTLNDRFKKRFQINRTVHIFTPRCQRSTLFQIPNASELFQKRNTSNRRVEPVTVFDPNYREILEDKRFQNSYRATL